MTLNVRISRIRYQPIIRICQVCMTSWEKEEEMIPEQRTFRMTLRYLTKIVCHPIGTQKVFSLALQLANVRQNERINSRNFSKRENNLPPGWTLSASLTPFRRVTKRIHFALRVRMGITFSCQSTKSQRLIRSYSVQMLRISHLRYWTRSTGVESAARSTSKSSRSAEPRTWMS